MWSKLVINPLLIFQVISLRPRQAMVPFASSLFQNTNDLNLYVVSLVHDHCTPTCFAWSESFRISSINPKQIECGFGTLNTICIDMMALIFLDNMFAGMKHARLHVIEQNMAQAFITAVPIPNIHAFYWCCCKLCCWTWLQSQAYIDCRFIYIVILYECVCMFARDIHI